jgi:hypothetical protein
MMTITLPLAVGPDALWVLVTYVDPATGEQLGTDAFRLAITINNGNYCTCPPECFDTDAFVPVSRLTTEPLTGYRWATVSDTERCAYPAANWGQAA